MLATRLIEILQSIVAEQGEDITVFVPAGAAPWQPLADVRQLDNLIGKTVHFNSEESGEGWSNHHRIYGPEAFADVVTQIVVREYQQV